VTDNISEQIMKASSKTLESLAFLEVYAAEESVDYSEMEVMSVHLQILEPCKGTLGLQTSKTFLRKVGEGIFSIPADDLDSQQIEDLLNELLNTIAGSFLSLALSDDEQFAISLPIPGLGGLGPADNHSHWDFSTDAGNFTIHATGDMLEEL